MTLPNQAAAPLPQDARVAIDSHVLGSLHVDPRDVRTFRHGLLGFPAYRRFALLSLTDRAGMYWLQSVDVPTLAFLLVDPFLVSDGYAVDLTDIDRHDLAVHDPADVLMLVIVTLANAADGPCTANFQGPIAINLRTGLGKQLVLAESPLGVRTPVDLSRFVA
ncbi:MAG TPA: flagellar assembly protein FliW [Gemmatimonadaceae bacterium]|nr:flagellar assembly protein FliW [Gemmatimonadaceae bacterium]